jgi:hypothetical protein
VIKNLFLFLVLCVAVGHKRGYGKSRQEAEEEQHG